ncbi:MAG: GNAT family N-acetyltransferase [Pseudomonadota bacterium]
MTRYRTATLSELSLILDWAAEEGWNPGLDDAEAFFATDPGGFFVAVDKQDEPIASISVINHTADFAFLGLYIVRKEFRGRGIGLGLWRHAMQHAGSRTVGLDGVEAQQNNYRSSGFDYSGATTRFTGRLTEQIGQDIRTVELQDIPTLIQMEGEASGESKPGYLRPWLIGSDTRATFVKRDQSGRFSFCTIRTCQTGAKIGPLVATNVDVARELIAHAATGISGPISMDVPNTSTALTKMCRTMEWQPGFQTARMYKGVFDASGHKCFAVTSLELG